MASLYDTKQLPQAVSAPAFAPPWWQRLALVLLLAAVLVASNWSVIGTVNYELGDFAANSLLIQDAKSLALFTGNYSRVGFNHPGPAILYVLAAGEVVFHDWLHVARSPFSGQLMAVTLYNAAWMILIFTTLAKMLRSRVAAMLTVSVLALALAFLDYQIFTGIWFPHLYLFPFAAMLVTGARLVDGHTDALPGLGIACGFLMNGHVSFVAILGIVFLTVAAANYLAQRGQANRLILHKGFLGANKGPVLRFFAIIGVFLLPLAIETVRRFPGPVAEYAAFGGHTKHNSLLQAIQYTGVYWGGTVFAAMLAAGLAGMLFIHARRSGGDVGRAVCALLAAGVGATLALLFYAKVGIDLLEFSYIGLFYYAVPALAIATAAACLYQAMQWRGKHVLAFVLVAVFGVATWQKIQKPVEYLPQYNQPEVQHLYKTMRALPRQGRLVLDLDFAQDQGFIWTNVLGLQAYAKRKGDDFFCVNKNWHISNTRAGRCTPDEVIRGQRYQIRKVVEGMAPPLAQGMGLGVYRFELPDLAALSEVTVAARPELFNNFILDSGWSALENQFVWSEGKTSRLVLRLPSNFAGVAELDLGSFIPRPEADQVLTVEAGAAPSGPHRFVSTEQRKRIRVPVQADGDGIVTIVLHIDHPVSPKQVGMSEDARALGVSLYGIKLERQ
ncbi:hypothetical protein [Massilia sp. Mn16-1_5]|uniref:hypothetical protein n=1 Tax=Massilia sp. Mn16-1_5 TaxID=2079199 RepID=UPI00109EB56A|nr:hypothetical protein [Massilia sp. Mn16-1_5]THC45646.1 hypothetical protein C2862_03935 [Massilia sp. Mn16-1_5]